jgi:hypothetical protein
MIVEGALRAISGFMKDVEEDVVRVGVVVTGMMAAEVGAVLVCADVSLVMMQREMKQTHHCDRSRS